MAAKRAFFLYYAEEHIHDLRIELSARAFPQNRMGFVERHAFAIRPVGHKRVVNISNGKNATVQADVLSGNSVRITFAVKPLVVFTHDGQKFLESRNWLQDSHADKYMLLDVQPLFRGQRPRLVQNLQGNPDLPYIVK